MIHDRLTLNAVRAPTNEVLILDGFHMSSFLSTWFRPGGAASALYPVGANLAALRAPERVQEKRPPSYVSDVFSLGHVAARVFADEVPIPPVQDESAHREWNQRQREAVREARLPRLLAESILAMIEFDPRDRPPSAVAICDRLATAHDAILHELTWRAGVADEPLYELLYLDESITRLHRDGLAASTPSSPSFDEYNEVIERDLERARMVWSPEGFAPWERIDREKAREAKVVLLGRIYAYFCAYLRVGRNGVEDRARLVVKHLRPIEQTLILKRRRRIRAAPRVKCGHLRSSGTTPARITGTTDASWEDLAESVRSHDAGASDVSDAARWLLDAQRGEHRRRWFQVRISAVGDLVRLEATEQAHDSVADVAGAFGLLWEQVSPRDHINKEFARLHRHGQEEGESQVFLLYRLRDDRDPVAELIFERDDGPDVCVFRMIEPVAQLPDMGWVAPDDRGARGVLNRQQEALLELEERCSHLASQFRHPTSVRIPLDTEEPAADRHEPLIRTILETWPMFIVQGPPGTGKTRLAARVVARVLALDPFSRILVTAQSHQAVDNLLSEVAKQRSGDLLRIASERTERRISAEALAYTLEKRLDSLLATCASAAGSSRPSEIVRQWAQRAKDKDPVLHADLLVRIRSSSSVTFVSTAQASADQLGANRGPATYDWVIVEEAARGWITDFLMPMTHGSRWLLIGDQAQLAAHQHRDYERLFDHDLTHEVTSIATGATPKTEWKKYLSYFGHLMTVPPLSPRTNDLPRRQLTLQHRMHPETGALISETFYQRSVAHHDRTKRNHGLKEVPFSGTALLWLDTGPLGVAAHEQNRKGLINLAEAEALRHIVLQRIGTPPRPEPGIVPLVAISPYRAQWKLLRERLQLGEDQVHTVDSFQGGQAEIVLVSLVRNGPVDDPGRALGFLEEPSRVNVMFSRARRLLVVAGNLTHFEQHGSGSFWKGICAYFRKEARFVRAVQIGDLPRRAF